MNHDEQRVFTVGHSNHSLDTFLDLVKKHDIRVLVDTRSQPYSRRSPHFGRESLKRALRQVKVRYLFMGDTLGGRPKDENFYDAAGKVLYDRIDEQEFYQKGIDRLLDGIRQYRVCLLCSEEDPIRCHRRLLIGRTLVRRGLDVLHIRGNGHVEPESQTQARMTQDLPSTTQLGLL